MISKEIAIKTIHQFFYEQIEKTPLITDEDGEHYITAEVEPFLEMNKDLSKLIKSIPDQDRRGQWIDLGERVYSFKCSKCKMTSEHISNYCPNCGAKMEEQE